MNEKIRVKFQKARRAMCEALVERDAEIDLVLTGLLSQESVLLVGPPGVAKSLLADSVLAMIEGAKKFSMLFTKFSTPEECIGPIDIAELKKSRYVRVATGKIPEAEVVFGDELFKANSAILNCLLKILNERRFDRGDGVERDVPLKLFIAASNEFPHGQEGGKELGALFDRLLLRKKVMPVMTARGVGRLETEDDFTPKFQERLTVAELDEAHRDVLAMPVSQEAYDARQSIFSQLKADGILVGDRRRVKSKKVMRAAAYLDGADEVLPDHLEALSHVLWDDPAEQPDRVAQTVAKVANPSKMAINALLLESEQVLSGFEAGNMQSGITVTSKLAEIAKKLKGLPKSPKTQEALRHVEAQNKAVKVKIMESTL